ncbi:MAG: hypothetical protein HZA51_08570 [Planctomycetes bacterium]|nr:hypothetical protein [Planctomycetota bacterium]
MTMTKPADIPTIVWRVERGHALSRAAWRLLAMVIFGAVLFIVRLDWHLLWLTDKASFLGLGLMMLVPLLAALAFAVSALRWLILALRPTPSHITLSPAGLTIDLGPFGKRQHPWTDLRLEIDADLDPELLAQLPDDAFVPKLICLSTNEDAIQTAIRFAGLEHEHVTRAMRPYMTTIAQ